MIVLRCVRCNGYRHPNRHYEGMFIRRFDTLEDVVKYVFNASKTGLYFPYLHSDIGYTRYRAFLSKCRTLAKNKLLPLYHTVQHSNKEV